MLEDARRDLLLAAYNRLRERIEAKDVTVEGLKAAAIDALRSAKLHLDLELDPAWIEKELDRIREEPPAPKTKE